MSESSWGLPRILSAPSDEERSTYSTVEIYSFLTGSAAPGISSALFPSSDLNFQTQRFFCLLLPRQLDLPDTPISLFSSDLEYLPEN